MALRSAILRKPLGLEFRQKDLDSEYDSVHLVMMEGEGVIGCLVLKPLDDATYKMRQVAVDERYRGQSLGRKLVEASEQVCRRLGAECIVLHARMVAVDFYLKLDYHIDGDVFEEVGVKHYKMLKAL